MRKQINTWTAVFIGILLVTSCNSDSSNTLNLNNGRYGGIVRINTTEAPTSFYPPQALNASSINMIRLINETVLRYDSESDSIVGNLAEKFEVNRVGDEYTFYLRENIFFQNNACFPKGKGRELKASDVAFCLTNLCDKVDNNKFSSLITHQIQGGVERQNSGNPDDNESYLSGIQIVDDYTLKIKLTKPSYTFLNLLTHSASSIYPKEALEHYKEKITNNPVGTGPFFLKTNDKEKATIFERNSNYWQVDENGDRLPYLDGVKVTFEKKEKIIRSAVGQKSIDVLINPDQKLAEEIGKLDNYQVESNPSFMITFYSIPVNDPKYDNVNFRKALNYAIDRDYIVDSVLFGQALKANYGIIPKTFEDHSIDGYTFDPEKAKSYLAKAGYSPGDKLPKVNINVLNSKDGVAVAHSVKQMLKENLGLISEVTALIKEMHYDRYDAGELELAYSDWIADHIDPDDFLCLYLSSLTPENGGQNACHYSNKAFDEALMNGMNEFDAEKRKFFYTEANKILYEDAALIPLYTKHHTCVKTTNIMNFVINSNQDFVLTNTYFELEQETE